MPKRLIGRVILFCLFLIPCMSTVALAGGGRSLTGKWSTQGMVPYLQQTGPEEPELFYTDLTWTLTEDVNGLISGVSDFVAYDSEFTEISAGRLKLVGTDSGRTFALAQGGLAESTTTGMTFQCKRRGSRRILCLGTSTGPLSPLGLQLSLTRIDDQ